MSYNFPYELRSGNNFQYSFVVDDLEATLQKYGYQKNVKLVPVFTTQSGKKFSGKAFDLVPDT
ncbi:hypothetical protein IIQ43_11955 [Acinetobacter oleivorans]|uniref:Uncharacterized protein n=1 Tax=Acinetobacter oleivorans TaxID=1148157 RepID=A0ABR9NK01_9GAMM|nr:hypothetical protein [Acinetobacter oleivorans]MBE2165243.1 hypothetical protein [Acinetobacter oleivorans]